MEFLATAWSYQALQKNPTFTTVYLKEYLANNVGQSKYKSVPIYFFIP